MPTLTNRLLWATMTLFSLVVALVSYRYLAGVGPLAPEILQNAFARPWLTVHVAGAATALLIAPAQFVARVRRARPGAHRMLGRIYVVGCVVGGVGGLILAPGSTAGPIATAGFGVLAALWIFATVRAWRLAVQRRFVEHRAWMLRSFALTFAAVTLRIGLVVLPLAGMSFLDAYRALAFLSWIPNLLVVELLLARQRRLQPEATIVR